jgi:hypothetical protein
MPPPIYTRYNLGSIIKISFFKSLILFFRIIFVLYNMVVKHKLHNEILTAKKT